MYHLKRIHMLEKLRSGINYGAVGFACVRAWFYLFHLEWLFIKNWILLYSVLSFLCFWWFYIRWICLNEILMRRISFLFLSKLRVISLSTSLLCITIKHLLPLVLGAQEIFLHSHFMLSIIQVEPHQ